MAFAAQGNYLSSSDSLSQIVNSGVTLSQTNIILSILNNNDGSFNLDVLGTPQAVYYLVSSSDVTLPSASWALVPGSTNTADTVTGRWSFTVTNPPPSYYRSIAVNPAP